MNEHTRQVSGPFVLFSGANGRTVIRIDSPLRRLNYFDGKFLRAEDLRLEQDYLRALIHHSNQGGGAGVVHGFDVDLQGDQLLLSGGLALDPAGRVLLLEGAGEQIPLRELFERSGLKVALTPPKTVPSPAGPEFEDCAEVSELRTYEPSLSGDRYVISLSYAQGECGNEPVYGKLCEAACVTDTARPYRVDGLVVRARPLRVEAPLPASQSVQLGAHHLRSRLASAYFADEVRSQMPDSHISARGLTHGAWCNGAPEAGGTEVDIAVLARSGSTWFLDPWIVRRERMEAPSRRYWAWRMGMRPWDVFLAQILQFQCQLSDMLRSPRAMARLSDPCRDERRVLKRAAESILKLRDQVQPVAEVVRSPIEGRPERATVGAVSPLAERLQERELPLAGGALDRFRDLLRLDDELRVVLDRVRQTTDRALIDGGIVELPSAGYLPVDPDSGQTANEQVRALLGAGVDLRFCVVRPDYVPHALEEAQHMERISLLAGYDNPRALPPVDVLVPDGRIQERVVLPPGRGYEMELILAPGTLPGLGATTAKQSLTNLSGSTTTEPTLTFFGAARSERLPGGGSAFYYAGLTAQRRLARPELADFIKDRVDLADRFHFDPQEAAPAAPAAPPSTAPAPTPSMLGAMMHRAVDETAEVVGEAKKVMEDAVRDAGEQPSDGEIRTTSAQPASFTGKLFGDRTWLPQDVVADIVNFPNFPVIDIPFLRPKRAQLETSFWADMQMERDLFDASSESYSRVDARFILLRATPDKVTVTSLSFRGDLHVQRRARLQDGRATLQAVLAGQGELRTRELGSTGAAPPAVPIDLREDLVLERRRGADGLPVTEVHVPRPRLFSALRRAAPALRFSRRWTELDVAATVRGEMELSTSLGSTQPSQGLAGRTRRGFENVLSGAADKLASGSESLRYLASRARMMFQASQRVEQAVLAPGHRAHEASTTAIRHLHSALGELGFADLAGQRLFPPPRVVEARELIVHPTLDWVLFHRRRDKRCQPDVEAAPRVRSRTFRLFHVRLQSEDERERLDAVLRESRAGDLGDFQAQVVGLVEFGPGVSTVLTPRNLVGTRWDERVGRGGEIVYAALAAGGDAAEETGSLGAARVQSLVEILEDEQVATLDDDAPLTVLPRVPDALSADDADGVLVVASVEERTECHQVSHIALSEKDSPVVRERIRANPSTLPTFGGVPLDTPLHFRRHSSQLRSGADELDQFWKQLEEPVVREIWLVTRETDAEALQWLQKQAVTIAMLANGEDAVKQVTVVQPGGDLPGECAAMTVLVSRPPAVETVCNEVLHARMIERTDLTDEVVRLRLGQVAEVLAKTGESALAELHRMGAVNFLAGSANPADGTLQSLPEDARLPDGTTWASAFANGLQGRRVGYLAVSPSATSPDAAKQHQQQAEAIRSVLGDTVQAVPVALGSSLTRQCGAVTIAVVFANSFDQQMVRAMIVAGEGDAAPQEVQFHFDDAGEVIRDESFDRAVRTLQDAKVSLGSVELASPAEVPDTEDRRLLSLYDALSQEGLVTDDASVETRKLDPQEEEVSPDLVFQPSVFFFRTRPQ